VGFLAWQRFSYMSTPQKMSIQNQKLSVVMQNYLKTPGIQVVKLSNIDLNQVADVRDIHRNGVDKLK
jgi:hypothetical protein